MNLDARPIAAYIRISKADEESVSLDKQRAAILALLAAKGWTAEVVWFVDEGVSGSKDIKREGRDDLEERMAAGEFAALVVNSIDRLARNTGDFDRILKVAENSGTSVAIVQEGFDTSSPWGLAMAKIVAVLAELEAKTIGLRVTQSNQTLREQGRRHGGKVCYGFQNIANPAGPGKVLAVREDQAQFVREAAERVTAGESVLAVSRDFTERGQRFTPSTLGKLLKRPTLYGATPLDGDVLRGRDGQPVLGAAILERAEWDALQEALAGRFKQANRKPNSNLPLLFGVARCGSCGHGLIGQRYQGRNSYQCRRPECPGRVGINMEGLEAHVLEHVLTTYGAEPLYRRIRIGGVDIAALSAIETEIAEAATRMATDDDADIAALTAQIAALRASRAALRAESGVRIVKRPTGLTVAQAYAAAQTTADRRAVLAGLVTAKIAKGKRGGVKVAFDPTRVEIVGV